MRELLSDTLGIALAVLLLFHLLLIQVFHSVVIFENNEWILLAELVMAVGVLALKIERLVDDVKRLRR